MSAYKAVKISYRRNWIVSTRKIYFIKPSNLRQLLNTFRKIAKHRNTFSSKKCDKYALCGNHGSHNNMVYKKDVLTI